VHDLRTTLAAVATARGRGGIGCVRISGPEAHRIAAASCDGLDPAKLRPDERPRFVTFVDAAGLPVDHGYAITFSAARSYTGEPAAELWAHGSPPVLDALVAGALARGAVLAGPGEFTYRALRHGRLDLARAEAIRDLIDARTSYQARVAFAQVNGAAARRLAPLREELIDLVARGEAAIEFADEAETHLAAGSLAAGVVAALARAGALADEARRGQIVRRGARIVFVGATSVGKSSLFNRVLGADRAIVSATPGTTRDTIEEVTAFAGIPATLVDTAGLRAPGSPVEAEGVRRARVAAGEADLKIVVLDASRALTPDERELVADRPRPLVVANKWDLVGSGATAAFDGAILVSAKTGFGLAELRAAIERSLAGPLAAEEPAITDLRQATALDEAVAALARAREAAPLGDEIVLEEVRDALRALGTITGEVANEELYDRIFATFCIGK
jgi:tRNA modification GTPase